MTMIFSFLSSTFGVACVSVARYTRPCGISGRWYAQKGKTTASVGISRCVGVHEMHDTSRDTAFLQNPKDYVTNNATRVTFGSFYVSTSNSRAQLITALRKAHLSADPHGISTKHERKPEIKSFTQEKKLFFDFFCFWCLEERRIKALKV